MSKKHFALAFAALSVVTAANAAEVAKPADILNKSVYSPGELLNRKFTLTASTGYSIDTIRDGTGKMYQKILIVPAPGQSFLTMISFYCINVNGESVETKKSYTFDASYLETQSFRPPAGAVGTLKESLFACGNFRSPSSPQPNAAAQPPAKPAASTATTKETSEGNYSNGKVTISVEFGPRGGTEITSSLCKGKVFSPKHDDASGMETDPKGSYAISYGGNYGHMDVESNEKCLPEGRYKKTSL